MQYNIYQIKKIIINDYRKLFFFGCVLLFFLLFHHDSIKSIFFLFFVCVDSGGGLKYATNNYNMIFNIQIRKKQRERETKKLGEKRMLTNKKSSGTPQSSTLKTNGTANSKTSMLVSSNNFILNENQSIPLSDVMHKLHVANYLTPTYCDYCSQLLFGLIKQGVKCESRCLTLVIFYLPACLCICQSRL